MRTKRQPLAARDCPAPVKCQVPLQVPLTWTRISCGWPGRLTGLLHAWASWDQSLPKATCYLTPWDPPWRLNISTTVEFLELLGWGQLRKGIWAHRGSLSLGQIKVHRRWKQMHTLKYSDCDFIWHLTSLIQGQMCSYQIFVGAWANLALIFLKSTISPSLQPESNRSLIKDLSRPFL